MQDPARFVSTYGGQHLAEVLQSLAKTAWMSSRYLNGVICPHSGTMAVTSIADLLFLAAFSVLITKFDDACTKAKLTTTLDASTAAEFYGVASCPAQVSTRSIVYIDDLNRPILCHPGQIISTIRKVTCILHRTIHLHRFFPNFQKGKTEATVLFNGAGSKEIQRQSTVDFDSVIPVRVRSAGKSITVDMRCVDLYKHLGTGFLPPIHNPSHQNTSRCDATCVLGH